MPRPISKIVLFMILGFVAGCNTIEVEPTDLTWMEQSAQLDAVVSHFGEPKELLNINDGTVINYNYDKGYKGKFDKPFKGSGWHCGGSILCVPAYAILGTIQAGVYANQTSEARDRQTGVLIFYFDKAGIMQAVSDQDKIYAIEKISSLEEYAEVVISAFNQEAEAQYSLASASLLQSDSFKWLCMSANNGHKRARSEFGSAYYYGHYKGFSFGESPNYEKAYLWYRLSWLRPGVTQLAWRQNKIREELTEERIAELDKQIETWQPNPSECRSTATKLSNRG